MTETVTVDAPVGIPQDRQIAASQVGAVFNSIHQFLESLKGKNEAGETLTSEQMRTAHERVEEASFWAVKHVLIYGVPAPLAPAAPASDAPPPDAPPSDFDTTPTEVPSV